MRYPYHVMIVKISRKDKNHMERSNNNCFISARAKGALGHFASKYCVEEIEFHSYYPIVTQNIQTAYGDLPQISSSISKPTLVSWY